MMDLAFLRRRLRPSEYLGLHFIFGLLIAAVCLWLFSDLTEDVVTRDPVVQVDLAVSEKLQALSSPIVTTIMVLFTTLGDFVTVGFCLTGLVVYKWRERPYLIGSWLITILGGELLNLLLKEWIHRPRPEMVLYHVRGYSFPSGHAMVSLVAYGLITYLLCLKKRSWKVRTTLMCGCAIVVLLIGLSRIYLGVHYFSDVIAGFAAGGVWLSTCITATELVRKKRIKGSTKIINALK